MQTSSWYSTKSNTTSSISMNSQFLQRNSGYMDGENSGSKSYIQHDENNFSIGVIIAFSISRVYGVIRSNKTTDSELFWYFLDKLFTENSDELKTHNTRTILLMDNAPYHKSRIVQDFIKNSGATIVTITPYWPCLNPAEKIIMCIKQKLKRQQWNGK